MCLLSWFNIEMKDYHKVKCTDIEVKIEEQSANERERARRVTRILHNKAELIKSGAKKRTSSANPG